jgi:phosphoribosylformylglycinamidine synthase subunit PurQ / glutaminase
MSEARVLILKTAGVNCDAETAFAFRAAGAATELVHINELVTREKKLADYQIIAFPGGFSYGDDIAAGKILANEIKFKLFEETKSFVEKGGLIIGICNGFQVLVRAGLLPGNQAFAQEAALVNNDCGVFQDRWVYLKGANGDKTTRRQESKCVWTRGLPEVVYLPIAHGEGKFIPKNEDVLDRLKRNGQIVFQYCDKRGQSGDFPINPNGSVDSIAGICDETGRVFGLMPHPERHLVSLQHPRWTREGLKKHGDGYQIFLNAVNYFNS